MGNAATTGLYNTAIGRGVLQSVTTGFSNVGVGIWSMNILTTGHINTAIGTNTMRLSTTGYANVALGAGALEYNTTGYENTAVGASALASNTTGIENTANGRQALFSNTTGFYNTANGQGALYSNTTGNLNTANGYYALVSNTTGSNNTALGPSAGRYINAGTNLTGVNSGVFLGSDTRALAVGDTNTIVIGSDARGLGSNTAVLGNSSITATRLQGRVGIGANPTTAAGDAQLQVTAAAADNRGLVIAGAASQTANLFEARNNAGTVLASISSAGAGSFVGLTSTGTNTLTGATNINTTGSAATTLGSATSATSIGGTLGVTGTSSFTGAATFATDITVNSLRVGRGAAGDANSTALGVSALGNAATTGLYNTAIGRGVLHSVTTGNSNVGVGVWSMNILTTGDTNTTIGTNTMRLSTAASANTAIGAGALEYNQTGNYNVALGYRAGLNETGSRKLYISSSESYNLIVGDFDDGRLLINALGGTSFTTPTGPSAAALQVNVVANADVGLLVNGGFGQSGNLIEAKVNGGSNLFSVSATGDTSIAGTLAVTGTSTLSGRVGIGAAPTTAAADAMLQVTATTDAARGLVIRANSATQTGNLFEAQTSGGAAVATINAAGNMTVTSLTQTSDARFKTNVQAITDALAIVRRLQGVSYDWNRAAYPERGFSSRPQIGVIAQQVEQVLPELVDTDAQGYKSVNYIGLVPVLIEGMKQQADRMDVQDERLAKTEKQLGLVEERLFKNEEQVVKLDERMGKAESFVARFELTAEPDTMVVLTPTFKVQNFTAERAYIAELRAQRIEAEKARFKELDADDAVIDNVDAARLRGRVVNTGGKELFVSYGSVAPLFEVAQDGHYMVSVTAEDGSFATAQVVNAGGVVRVVPTAGQGIDVVANGNSVGLVAPSKKVKASWTRTG